MKELPRITRAFMYEVPLYRCSQKNASESIKHRTRANVIHASKHRCTGAQIHSWILYTESIIQAPSGSPELASGYANRSALLLKMRKYSDCISDIDRALSSNSLDHVKGILLSRKAECLKLLGQPEANDVVEEATRWLERMSLDEKSRNKHVKRMTNASISELEPIAEEFWKVQPSIVPQKEVPCASEAIALVHNRKYGRHMVATRKISPGEILMIEKPFATVLRLNDYIHCSYCLKMSWTNVPCSGCILMLYCSEKCRDEAWNEYHDMECPVIGYLVDSNLRETEIFALRIVILGLKSAGSIQALEEEVNVVDDCEGNWKKYSSLGLQ